MEPPETQGIDALKNLPLNLCLLEPTEAVAQLTLYSKLAARQNAEANYKDENELNRILDEIDDHSGGFILSETMIKKIHDGKDPWTGNEIVPKPDKFEKLVDYYVVHVLPRFIQENPFPLIPNNAEAGSSDIKSRAVVGVLADLAGMVNEKATYEDAIAVIAKVLAKYSNDYETHGYQGPILNYVGALMMGEVLSNSLETLENPRVDDLFISREFVEQLIYLYATELKTKGDDISILFFVTGMKLSDERSSDEKLNYLIEFYSGNSPDTG